VTAFITPQLQLAAPQPGVQPEEVAPEPIPRLPTHPLVPKRVVKPPSGGVDRIEIGEEPKSKRSTKFRSIADVLMITKIEKE